MSTNSITTLCNAYVEDMQRLHEMDTYDACQLLLCAGDLGLSSPAIRTRIERLEQEQPALRSDAEDLLQSIIRQLVFTSYEVAIDSRRRFIDYWLNERRYRGRGFVAVSFLIDLGIENESFLTPVLRAYVCRWYLRHSNFQAERVAAWAAHSLWKLGHEKESKAAVKDLLARRAPNGSWGDDLPRTIACAYPLAKAGLASASDLSSTLSYVLVKLERGYVYGAANRAAALKLLSRLGVIPDSNLQFIRGRIENSGSIFLSHSHFDKEFVRRLASRLAAYEVPCWVDEAEILPGDSLMDKIEEGIERMHYLGVVLSPRALSSGWVKKELNMALVQDLAERSVRVIPLLAERCRVPLRVRDLRYVEFTEDFEFGFSDLMRRLRPELTLGIHDSDVEPRKERPTKPLHRAADAAGEG